MSTTPAYMTRGYMIMSCVTHIRRAYDAKTSASIMDRLAPDTRKVIDNVKPVEWYARDHAKGLFTAIARHHLEGDGKMHEGMVGCGRCIAEMASNTFLRLLMKLMTPTLFARKVGSFWERDHRGGALTADMTRINQKELTFVHTGIGGYDFVGACAPGFLGYALEAIGCKNVVNETTGFSVENPGPEEVRYRMRWD